MFDGDRLLSMTFYVEKRIWFRPQYANEISSNDGLSMYKIQ